MNRLLQLKNQIVSNSSFDENQLNRLIFGENYQLRYIAWKVIRENKEYRHHFHLKDYPLDEIRSRSFDKLKISYKNAPDLEAAKQMDFSVANRLTLYSNGFIANDLNFCILGGVHSYLYCRAIFQLGTEKHRNQFLKAIGFNQIGCFGLTQLLHGSNVKGIWTQAHYDHKNKEFVINTPSKQAMKFWIGGAAKTASTSVIWAQLYIDGKCHGVHAFIVPIRD